MNRLMSSATSHSTSHSTSQATSQATSHSNDEARDREAGWPERGEAKHEGGCACGAWRFVVSSNPDRVGLCHCMTCRKVHGSAFGAYAVYLAEQVTMSGATRAWQSSADARRHFCTVCGSVAYMAYVNTDEIDLPIGAFDETGFLEPTYELFCVHREPWLSADGRREYPEDRP
jgi:hypothetical protein